MNINVGLSLFGLTWRTILTFVGAIDANLLNSPELLLKSTAVKLFALTETFSRSANAADFFETLSPEGILQGFTEENFQKDMFEGISKIFFEKILKKCQGMELWNKTPE